ncbi:NAD-dependent epimerase/dehydratase family protein [Dysgonomonas sp. 520]|uniref:NAD-dependent epimerase/dehydratase family protein n=1 Tax=Dysgonomonas sp. 520 TaxID=2302931 RepID=UPI0013D2DD80|nr:NAD-dependent epimerase/dehydratase family protein [Dysgonomonas sp. 520]NDW08953.1 NAD-dependent epimerase/dehydratase family protein [Dysgonomonas sp. 520]
MNILITGIHGFVGGNLVNSLKNKHSIYGLDIVTPAKDGVEKTYKWDELDKLPDIDAIIHLAGKAHDTKNQTESQIYFDINTGLTQKIYDWYLNSNARKFIFFSSVKAAADVVVSDILTEDIIPNPVGPYGESKIAAENYILQHLPKDKYVYIFRPCMIHGPGNKGNLNLLYSFIEKGIPYPLGAFDNKRSFTSIDNLSFFIDRVIDKDIETGIYNIADDEPLSTNELIRLICKALDRKPRIWNISKSLVSAGAKVGDILHLPLNTFRLNKLTENYVVSNKKIKESIGVEKLPVTSSDGIIKTIKSFKKRN